jgi:hypothetical protein
MAVADTSFLSSFLSGDLGQAKTSTALKINRQWRAPSTLGIGTMSARPG